ncbi:DUF397 domain-containing protein [Streptomyces filamentosus]|uniref:DUF397 domain-containing protein n=2 Tax=Streptomyces filamentosus TaxID=67294 RepID=A0ABY4UVM3_STRFL|nr:MULTISPECIES: DUF397 domain-containing protein [Streptomyces]EFE76343.1 conserved hypothetical protein [Streptomyces filamentosus NRRL 15998]ESU49557.1 hypothetical protein P376_2464 [Streptomyces sp. HCCB10043]EWS93322.1 hypothetical protein SSIG_03909 [Streptomyces filamentosus NRRL 11379]MYR80330.1 DUF397 domain-containing protein [Streptomyces sp. SID5466]USC48144.1 DUF397 domain-containing protein [Streptomyces filamentosus]
MTSTLRWFKSSYSSGSGGNCIEVAFAWRTSSYSSDSGGNCVEVATCPHSVHVRDSKVSDGPVFAVAPDAWSAFVTWAE